jgi:hypothetical protein
MDYTQEKSDSFEDELDEFFKERALFRAQVISDNPKNLSGSLREEKDCVFDNQGQSAGFSGCCMTGCHDCPWGYTIPSS